MCFAQYRIQTKKKGRVSVDIVYQTPEMVEGFIQVFFKVFQIPL